MLEFNPFHDDWPTNAIEGNIKARRQVNWLDNLLLHKSTRKT